MAVCDVSGSMSGISMEVSVALGVLVSELSEEPWKGKLITFSKNPKLQKATPVLGSQNGVALVSGFSKNLIKMFLDEDGDINPEAVIEAAISGEEYQKLVVLD
ncbi:hypothetical protein QUC31_014542 [Theobroma cacao]